MDEMWGRVNSKKTSSWLWHAINHDNGDVVAYVIGSRHHDMLWQLTDLIYSLNLNITAVYSDDNLLTMMLFPIILFIPVKLILKKSNASIFLFVLALNA